MKKPKIAVGMSGGVDSSVTAALLKQQGYQISGVFMQNYTDPNDPACRTEEDRAEAIKVASYLNIPITIMDLEKDYREKVVEYFYSEYQKGRTPNPDVMCNKEIKFNLFLNKAIKELGVDYIATGHYARIKEEDGFHLLKGADPKKDQTYFLYTMNSYSLSKTLFPIGGLTKVQVRQKAKEFKLPNADRPDSQGICFIGEVNIFEFLKKRIPEKVGDVVDTQGKVIGKHKGIAFYTIGQREGIGVSGTGIPYYIVGKDVEKNILVAAPLNNDQALYHKTLVARSLAWVKEAPLKGKTYKAKIRYQQPDQEVVVKKITQEFIELEFTEKQRAITVGQSVVLYDGEEVVGGGTIEAIKD